MDRPTPPAGALRLLKAKSKARPASGAGSAHSVGMAAKTPLPPPAPEQGDNGADLGTEEIEEIEDAGGAALGIHSLPVQRKTKGALAWWCHDCGRECLPIREESRCLCGHRLKDHSPPGSGVGALKCRNGSCRCKEFFYIVAEGAWILRCRCKHKHVEHDPVTRACTKPACATTCKAFDSPWVCNCDHPWGHHEQVAVERAALTIEELAAGRGLGPGDIQTPLDVQRGR